MPAPVTPVEIALRLGPLLTYRAKLAAASDLLARMDRLSAANCEALLAALQPQTESDRILRRSWLTALPASAAAHYLQAASAAADRDAEEAASAWARVFAAAPCDDPFVFLEHARMLASLGRSDAAAAQLRRALGLQPPYAFFSRAQHLLDRLWREAPPSARHARIAVLGSSTTSLMAAALRALAFRDGIDARFYEGIYGAYRQEILLPESGLSRFMPDIVILATNYRDLHLPAVEADDDAAVDRIVQEYRGLWQALADRFACHVIQHAFECPPYESYGPIASRMPGGRTRMVRLVNMRLEAEAPAFVSMVDVERVIAAVGLAAWHQPGLWQIARQHPGTEALPALCEEQLSHIRAVLGLARKVLVCDLDNTLWGGVIGEDGLEGIRIGPGSADGECHAELQRYLRELKDRGVLLAVCSKNNPADARRPFEKHTGMVLGLDDFVAFVANWDDKVTNLRRIADTLRLGLDSFVVLDDNPMERAWIRQELPQVAVVELGPSASTYVRELDRGRHFVSLTWSAEDRARTDQYRRIAAIESERPASGSLDAFLEGLHMRATCGPIGPENLARVVQLTNKTNQFNLRTKRYTEAQVERLRAMPGAWSGVFTLSDCYGDHGIVGLLIAVPAGTATWDIDTWLMSCRVLGRRFEEFMMDRLVEAARQHNVETIVGTYQPTEKNGLVADLYPRLGFAADGVNDSFVLDVASVTRPPAQFIEHTQFAMAC